MQNEKMTMTETERIWGENTQNEDKNKQNEAMNTGRKVEISSCAKKKKMHTDVFNVKINIINFLCF